MKRHHMSKLEGEESMQRTNRMVLGLLAVFVLGGSLVLVSCGGGDDTTDITTSNAASLLSCRQFTFSGETDFNVTVNATLGFNNGATRFGLLGPSGSAVGSVNYGDGSCTFTVDRDGVSGIVFGPTPNLIVTADPCQIDDSNNNNLILNDTTSVSNAPIQGTSFGNFNCP
jgi:hypothetical protein